MSMIDARAERPGALPRLVVFGEALTDMVRTGADSWRSIAGGACWNVARVAATLGVRTGWGGAVSDDLFGREIVARSHEAGLDPRFLQVVAKAPLIAMVHALDPPDYFFLGNDSAATKGSSITFGTSSTTFTIFRCNSGAWRITKEFTGDGAEANCIAWCDTKLGKPTTGGG